MGRRFPVRAFSGGLVAVLTARTGDSGMRLSDFPLLFVQPRLLSDADVGDGVEQSKYVAEPPQHTNDDDYIQNRLDGTCHWDEAVDQPQDYANDDQGEQYLN
jgi:hypothetical protein